MNLFTQNISTSTSHTKVRFLQENFATDHFLVRTPATKIPQSTLLSQSSDPEPYLLVSSLLIYEISVGNLFNLP